MMILIKMKKMMKKKNYSYTENMTKNSFDVNYKMNFGNCLKKMRMMSYSITKMNRN